jgi:hypothetical protein
MKQASIKTLTEIKALSEKFQGQDPHTVAKLKTVADAFIRLQDFRHDADYDTSFELAPTAALAQIALASDAFVSWDAIRKEKIAQDYLLSLLVNR